MTWHDGSVYRGAWEHGMQHGLGRLELPDGRVKEGLFRQNKFVESPGKSSVKMEPMLSDNSFYKADFSQEDKIQRMRTDQTQPLSFDGKSDIQDTNDLPVLSPLETPKAVIRK